MIPPENSLRWALKKRLSSDSMPATNTPICSAAPRRPSAVLSAELGTRLLHRTTRQVQLTRDGLAFYERAKDLLGDVDELSSLFQSEPSQISGRVRIDMSSRMARFEIIPKLGRLLSEFPNLQIELGATDRKVDLVREGYDFVIRGGTLTDSGLIAKKIGEATTINAASGNYLKNMEHQSPSRISSLTIS